VSHSRGLPPGPYVHVAAPGTHTGGASPRTTTRRQGSVGLETSVVDRTGRGLQRRAATIPVRTVPNSNAPIMGGRHPHARVRLALG
jgi:hypothetical protein